MSGDGGQDFAESPGCGKQASPDGQSVLPEDIEINNTDIQNNGVINNSNSENWEIFIPKVKEITIKRPVAEGKCRPQPAQKHTEQEFVF